MDWQANISWEDAKLKADIFYHLRSFFRDRDVIEVETPVLSQGTVTDPYIDAFTCEYNYLSHSALSLADNLYLQTSPEYSMKRLLASGYESIYQITKAFRHEPSGRFHNPEFTLLEWYRLRFDHNQLMDEVEALLKHILGAVECKRISYQAIFIELLNIDPIATSYDQLVTLLLKHDKDISWISPDEPIDTLLQVVFSDVLEPLFDKDIVYFIYDFPSSQAALARKSLADERVAHRFECYFRGVELANGFYELTDALEQRSRFNADNCTRALNNKKKKPVDERFMGAIEYGLPDCSGVALGIDRLVMLALNKSTIGEVLSFPIEKA